MASKNGTQVIGIMFSVLLSLPSHAACDNSTSVIWLSPYRGSNPDLLQQAEQALVCLSTERVDTVPKAIKKKNSERFIYKTLQKNHDIRRLFWPSADELDVEFRQGERIESQDFDECVLVISITLVPAHVVRLSIAGTSPEIAQRIHFHSHDINPVSDDDFLDCPDPDYKQPADAARFKLGSAGKFLWVYLDESAVFKVPSEVLINSDEILLTDHVYTTQGTLPMRGGATRLAREERGFNADFLGSITLVVERL